MAISVSNAVLSNNEVIELLWREEIGDVFTVAISNDGDYVAAGTYYNHEIFLFDRTGRLLWKRITPITHCVNGLAFSYDNKYIAAVDWYGLYLYDINGNLQWSKWLLRWLADVDISADANYIVTCNNRGYLYMFDHDGNLQWRYIFTPEVWEDYGFYEVEMSADANYIAVAGRWIWKSGGFIQVFNKNGNELWKIYFGAGSEPDRGLAMSASGHFIAVLLRNGTLCLFDNYGNLLWKRTGYTGVYGLTISSNGQYIAFSGEGTIYIFNNKGKLLLAHKIGDPRLIHIMSLSFSNDGRYLAVGISGSRGPIGVHLFKIMIPIVATIDIDPDTLNLKGRGKSITCYIELPKDYDVSRIDVSTIKLLHEDNFIVSAELQPTEIGDYDEDGIPDLMIKFDRQALVDYLKKMQINGNEEVKLKVIGIVTNIPFEGYDTIQVISKNKDN